VLFGLVMLTANAMSRCLAAMRELAAEQDIDAGARALRLSQYAQCAAGHYCPEVAFDPVAIELRAIAARLEAERVFPALVATWRALVAAIVRASAR
jgi:hypothetical protein